MTMTVAHLVAEEAAHRELPMPPWVFGALALLAFAFLLGVTWSFRGTAQKHASPAAQHETGHGHDASPGHTYQAGHPEPEGDEPHWPEHPGHH
jgi:hypothetical protein